ncbi:hypothetical protein [Streptomyces nojiriensis]|uniref:hypothetical protein n=1 Tax=Streptomyces nojiriensis TaxID=66374 RepID=UPI0036662D98
MQGHAGHHCVDPGAVGEVTFETDMADPNASSSTDAAASTAAKTARLVPVWTASGPGCVQRRVGARGVDAVRHGFVTAGQGDDGRAVLRTDTQDAIRTDATGRSGCGEPCGQPTSSSGRFEPGGRVQLGQPPTLLCWVVATSK